MIHEETIEKLDMIEDPNLTVTSRLSSGQLKLYRIRKILLVILSIFLAFNLLYLIFVVHAYVDNSWFSRHFKSNYELLWTLLSIVYNAFGLIVTYRYFRIGLRVFAWIGTILLILSGISIGVICAVAFRTKNRTDQIDAFHTKSQMDHIVNDDIIGPLVFINIFITSSIMLLTIILLSFKLSTLLINNRSTPMRTI